MSVIESDPDVMWGTPLIAGTRVPAVALLDYIAAGATVEEFLIDFPSVSRETAMQLLADVGSSAD